MQFDYNQQPGLKRWAADVVKTEEPLVSIITPYYNGSAHIQQVCNCVLDQTFPYFEWIIVNDGSSNKEDVKYLEAIQRKDPRIRILHKENGGISTARNYAIRNARTDLILPLDDDDLLEPTFVEYCWWMLQKNPEAAWAYVDSVGFQNQEYLWMKRFDPEEMKTENLLTATALIRKDVLLQIGGYSEKKKHFNEDWHAWLKIIAKGGYPVQSKGEYLFWYRRNDTGVLSTVKNDRQIALENEKMIRSAAEAVKNPHPPVIYPQPFHYNWDHPKMSDWEKCIYREKKKKHILFLIPHFAMGGADKFNLDLLKGLDKDRFEISVITTVQSENPWLQAFRQVTPNLFNLPNFVEPKDYAEFISYYLKSRKVDILFVSNSYHGYYLIPWLRENFPELAIVDYVHMEEWYWRSGGYARTSGMAGGITEKTYVCNSGTRDVMIRNFGRSPDSVQTVYIGVDADYFDAQKVAPGTLYQQLSIPKSRPIVLFICRLHPQKRPFLMLEIAKRVAQSIPEVMFAVVGDGPQEAQLREKAAQMGLNDHVRFLGARKEVRPYYRDAKVTLVCSLKEGLSLTAYESCAMGVPVVSADVGGQKDLIDDSVGALIPCLQSEAEDFDARTFSETEIQAYVDAIRKLLSSPEMWKEKSANCRQKVLNGFTIRNMVEYFESEFDRLVKDVEAAKKRQAVTQALKLCSPMAADLFAVEMQHEAAEHAMCPPGAERIRDKIKRTLRDDGFLGVIRKALRFIYKRIMR